MWTCTYIFHIGMQISNISSLFRIIFFPEKMRSENLPKINFSTYGGVKDAI